MYRSKRFIAFLVAVLLFTTTIFFTNYPPLELAGAISIIVSIYIGAETMNKSKSNTNQ